MLSRCSGKKAAHPGSTEPPSSSRYGKVYGKRYHPHEISDRLLYSQSMCALAPSICYLLKCHVSCDSVLSSALLACYARTLSINSNPILLYWWSKITFLPHFHGLSVQWILEHNGRLYNSINDDTNLLVFVSSLNPRLSLMLLYISRTFRIQLPTTIQCALWMPSGGLWWGDSSRDQSSERPLAKVQYLSLP